MVISRTSSTVMSGSRRCSSRKAPAVNRLDQVVSVRGRNDDGRQLADTLDLRFTNYAKAVEAVLESPQVRRA